jgi:hypothetical protein
MLRRNKKLKFLLVLIEDLMIYEKQAGYGAASFAMNWLDNQKDA